jgi:hypothetical protein
MHHALLPPMHTARSLLKHFTHAWRTRRHGLGQKLVIVSCFGGISQRNDRPSTIVVQNVCSLLFLITLIRSLNTN